MSASARDKLKAAGFYRETVDLGDGVQIEVREVATASIRAMQGKRKKSDPHADFDAGMQLVADACYDPETGKRVWDSVADMLDSLGARRLQVIQRAVMRANGIEDAGQAAAKKG